MTEQTQLIELRKELDQIYMETAKLLARVGNIMAKLDADYNKDLNTQDWQEINERTLD